MGNFIQRDGGVWLEICTISCGVYSILLFFALLGAILLYRELWFGSIIYLYVMFFHAFGAPAEVIFLSYLY